MPRRLPNPRTATACSLGSRSATAEQREPAADHRHRRRRAARSRQSRSCRSSSRRGGGAEPADAVGGDVQSHHRAAHVFRHVARAMPSAKAVRSRCRTRSRSPAPPRSAHPVCQPNRASAATPEASIAAAKIARRLRSRSASWPPSSVPKMLPIANIAQRQRDRFQRQCVGRLQEGRVVHRHQPVADALGDPHGEQSQHRARQRRAHRRHARRAQSGRRRPPHGGCQQAGRRDQRQRRRCRH